MGLLRLSRASAFWLFWPALALVVWGELSPAGEGYLHVWDKLLHFTAYFGLAAMCWVALAGRKQLLWSLAGLVVLGGVLEIVQGFVGRDVSLDDEIANTIGVAAGAAAGWIYVTLLKARILVAPGEAE